VKKRKRAKLAKFQEAGPDGVRRELETKLWGPGRLRAALAEARRRGLVRRIGRRRYEAG
jgi:hypothetical protein